MSADHIPDELMASYIDGNATPEEISEINRLMEKDPELFKEFLLASGAAYLTDSLNEGPVADGEKFNIAASNTSLIAGGAGLAGMLLNAHHGMSGGIGSENFSHSDDSFTHHHGSIGENILHSTMENINSDSVFNPVQQQYEDTCAIKSQQLILNDFGINCNEDQLVHEAEQFNLYSPGNGTQMEDVGKLLELNGISCTQHENSTVYDLTAALAKGEKVIIGVDSGELWHHEIFEDFFKGEQADHALIVAGIDTSDPDNVQVILTDPGTGEEAARYPMDRFLDAWHDSGNFMVTTDMPAPLEHNPEMANFDYGLGHIPMIGQMPYDSFCQIYSLYPMVSSDADAVSLIYDNFSNMVDGNSASFSPELVNMINQYPLPDQYTDLQTGHHVFDNGSLNDDDISFNINSSDYDNGMMHHQGDIMHHDTGYADFNSDHDSNEYSNGDHGHSMDDLNNDF